MTITAYQHKIPVDRKKLLAHQLRAIKSYKAELAEFEEDRRLHGWTFGNPYCRHGVFIGDWAGPDYLCMACEAGISDYEFVIGNVSAQATRAQDSYKNAIEALVMYCDILKNLYDQDKATATPYFIEKAQEQLNIMAEIREEWL